jgi:hypothetical protein
MFPLAFPGFPSMLGIPGALRWGVAVAIFVGVVAVGFSLLRGLASARPTEPIEPEDVADLDVFFVCGECGTEYQVTRLGEAQVPRHCGEPMQVVRRPRSNPPD